MPTTRLNALADRTLGTQSFGLTNYDNLEADVNYLVVPGATLTAAATLTITNEAHLLTGSTSVQSIVDGLGASIGQQIRLICQSAVTIQHNAGGGNIRTRNGIDKQAGANEVVTLTFDGTYWWVTTTTGQRKTSDTTVNTTTSETDLLASAFTLPAGVLGPSGKLLLRAWGDYLQNGGSPVVLPRLKFKLGTTVIFDTGGGGTWSALAASSTRYGWSVEVEVLAKAATNVQSCRYRQDLTFPGGTSNPSPPAFTTGEGVVALIQGAGTPGIQVARATNAGAVDMTASQALVLSVILGASNAALEMKCTGAEWDVA